MSLTSEQRQLVQAVRTALTDFAPGGSRWSIDAPGDDTERDASWRVIADQLGLAGLLVPEEVGGAGASMLEAALLMEEAGRALVHLPFVASSILAASVLSAVVERPVHDASADALLAQLAGGDRVVTVAVGLLESGVVGGCPASIDDPGLLSATLPMVVDAGRSDVVLVPVESGPGAGLWAVGLRGPGVSISSAEGLDPSWPTGDLKLDGVPAVPLLPGRDGLAAVSHALDLACIALSSEAVGVADAALAATTKYVVQREQFGRAIGSFQAVQHACADMLVQVETARALSRQAAVSVGAPDVNVPLLASTTFLYCITAAQFVTGQAIQLHGGIGFTWEHPAQRYFKRASVLASALTTPAWHRRRLEVAFLVGELS